MRKVRELFNHKLFLSLSATILFLSFTINLFGAQAMFGFSSSEYIVTNQIACKGRLYSNQLLGFTSGKDSGDMVCVPENLLPYSSQYGLQGKVYTIGYRVLDKLVHIPVKVYARLAQIITAAISAIFLALIALWVKIKYGRFVAVVFTVLVACSPMAISFARDLYWVFPLMIAPLLLVLYFFKSQGDKSWHVKFYLSLGILLYLRYLCGYEYVTTITIMVIAAIAYYLFLNRSDKKTVLYHIGLAFIVSIAAFVMAFGTHIYSLKQEAGSISGAVEIVKRRAILRTVDTGSYTQYPVASFKNNLGHVYQVANEYLGLEKQIGKNSEVWATVAAVLNYALMPVTVLPIISKEPTATYLYSVAMFILLLVLLYIGRQKWTKPKQAWDLKALYVATGLGFVGFMSWMLLAPSHSIVHAHINGVLLYLPFALFGYIIIGLYLESLKDQLLEKKRR